MANFRQKFHSKFIGEQKPWNWQLITAISKLIIKSFSDDKTFLQPGKIHFP